MSAWKGSLYPLAATFQFVFQAEEEPTFQYQIIFDYDILVHSWYS